MKLKTIILSAIAVRGMAPPAFGKSNTVYFLDDLHRDHSVADTGLIPHEPGVSKIFLRRSHHDDAFLAFHVIETSGSIVAACLGVIFRFRLFLLCAKI